MFLHSSRFARTCILSFLMLAVTACSDDNAGTAPPNENPNPIDVGSNTDAGDVDTSIHTDTDTTGLDTNPSDTSEPPICENNCSTVGASRCDGAQVESCQVGEEECLVWVEVESCTAPTVCSQGRCVEECLDGCITENAVKCEGEATVVTCRDSNGDGCLEWTDPMSCAPPNGICSNGACASSCNDECTVVGARSCDGSGFKSCGNFDDDPCLEWGDVVPCMADATCSNGYCALECTDECDNAGTTQCSAGGVRSCGQFDNDPCLELNDPVACAASEVCSGGACLDVCMDTCDAEQIRCSGNGVQTCTIADSGCLEWGTAVACSPVDVCADGVCTTSEPPAQLVISEILYNTEGADDDTWIELHGPPGTALDGFSLVGVNGNGGTTYSVLDLSGTLDTNGLFLIVNSNASPQLQATANMVSGAVDYQNGPDSVQLLWGQTTIDALGYGSFADGTVFGGESNPALSPPPGYSLARDAHYTDTDNNAVDFTDARVPTPGQVNQISNQAPNAQLRCPAQATVGETVVLSGVDSSDPDGSIVTYAFHFGDGASTSSDAAEVEHTYETPDEYDVEITITDNNGAEDNALCTITVVGDACSGVVCDQHPAAQCLDNTARRYTSNGSCLAGTCTYGFVDTHCADGCASGTCTAPSCGGSTCDQPPEPFCTDANTLSITAPQGRCEADTCAYQESTVYCSEGCFNGRCVSGSWQTEQPPLEIEASLNDLDFIMDPLGNPHLVYCTGNDVVYRTRDAQGWREETVDAGAGGDDCQVAVNLDHQGRPMIAYFEPSNADLRFGWRIDGNFELDLVRNTGDVGQAPSVSITPEGQPIVAFSDSTERNLMVGTRTDGEWGFETVGAWSAFANPTTSIAWGPEQTLHIMAGSRRSLARSNGNYDQPEGVLHTRIEGVWTHVVFNADALVGRDTMRVHSDGSVMFGFGEVRDTGLSDQLKMTVVRDGVVVKEQFIRGFSNLAFNLPLGLYYTDTVPEIAMRTNLHYKVDDHGYWNTVFMPVPNQGTIIDLDWHPGQARATFLHHNLRITTPWACVPMCDGGARVCGGDGCGGSCGSCDQGLACAPTGVCGAWSYESLDPWYDDIGLLATDNLQAFGRYEEEAILHTTGSPGNWEIEPTDIDPDYDVASFGDDCIALDSEGRLHIAAVDRRPTHYNAWDMLYLYSETDTGWERVLLGEYFAGSELPTLRIDAQDNVHIAYNDRSYPDFRGLRLVYGFWNGTEYTATVVANPDAIDNRGSGGATSIDMELDSAGNAHILWVQGLYYTSQTSLHYATNAAGSWNDSVVVEVYNASYAFQTLLIDSDDALHLVYGRQTTGFYATQSGDTWSAEPIPLTRFGQFALTPNDALVMVLGQFGALAISTRTGAETWTTEEVPIMRSSSNPRVVFDDSARWHILYNAGGGDSQSQLRHMWR